jgi:lipoyl(octanoyl) transferase
MAPHLRTLLIHDLGRVEYEDGLALQKAFALARRSGVVGDVLLLLEHPSVITLGRGARAEHIKASQEVLASAGVRLHKTDRGGDVTYHGPGQVVGYPILDLAPDRCDVRRYVRDLEDVMVAAAADFGVEAGRIEGWTGTWVGERGRDARKLGAIGVHLSRWITTHGFAFNVAPQLSHFDLIVPCGIAEAGVTSLERELGRAPPLESAVKSLAHHMAARFDAASARARFEHRTVSVVVLRPGRRGLEALVLKRHPHRGGFWQPVTGTIDPAEEPEACAKRELGEETGLGAEVKPLRYTHSFLFGEPRADRPPRVFRETAFWALAPAVGKVRLDTREHSHYAWLDVSEAVDRVPYAGLKEALRRAHREALQASASTG